MKKLNYYEGLIWAFFTAIMLTIALPTKAQINYCDSIELNHYNSATFSVGLETNIGNLNIPSNWDIVEYDWTITDLNFNWHGWDSLPTPVFSLNPFIIPDTLLICLTVVAYDTSWNMIANCYNNCTDTLVYDPVSQWQLLSRMYVPDSLYCDSLSYNAQSVPNAPLTLQGTGFPIPSAPTWVWTVCGGGLCYSATGQSVSFPLISIYDTLKVCYDVTTYANNDTTNCQSCDSLIHDGNSWVLFNTSNPTSINELTFNKINDGKIYDMLGRELTEVPLGTMYIRNNKLYITK